MTPGVFGSLIHTSKTTYDYTLSGDFAMNQILTNKNFGKATFAKNVTNPIENQPALENLAEDGGLNVKS